MQEEVKPDPMAMPQPVVPVCDTSDPAQLEAWYGNFGFVEYWRKAVISNCREAIRARAALKNAKLTEARIDDLAHNHPAYIDFLTVNLHGRKVREDMIKSTYSR